MEFQDISRMRNTDGTGFNDNIHEKSFHHVERESEGHIISAYNTNRENVSRMTVFLVTIATAVVLIAEGIFNFKFVRQSQAIHLNVFFYWVQSCFITLLCNLWTRKKIRSFRSSTMHFLPLLVLHVALVTFNGVDIDYTLYGASGGSEVYQVGLVTAPLAALLATWHLLRQCYPVKVILFVGLSSLLLMAIICSENDPYIPFKVTFTYGSLGILNGTLMGYFIVLLKKYISKSSSSQVLYYLNVICAMVLPFVVFLTGEWTALQKELLQGGNYMNLFHQTITMAFLKLASQLLFLYHVRLVSPMLSLATRGLSWIFLTVALSLLGTSMNVELLVSDFIAFWVVGILFFLPVLVAELHWM